MSTSIMRNRAFHGDKQKDEAEADRALIASAIDVGDSFNLPSVAEVRMDMGVYVNDSVRTRPFDRAVYRA